MKLMDFPFQIYIRAYVKFLWDPNYLEAQSKQSQFKLYVFYYFVIRKFNTICDWSTITNEMLKRNELCGNQVEHKIQKCLAKGKIYD